MSSSSVPIGALDPFPPPSTAKAGRSSICFQPELSSFPSFSQRGSCCHGYPLLSPSLCSFPFSPSPFSLPQLTKSISNLTLHSMPIHLGLLPTMRFLPRTLWPSWMVGHSGATCLGLAAFVACMVLCPLPTAATWGTALFYLYLNHNNAHNSCFISFENNHSKPGMVAHIHNPTIKKLNQEAPCKFQASLDHSMRLKQTNRPRSMFITVRDTKAEKWEGQFLLSVTSDPEAH